MDQTSAGTIIAVIAAIAGLVTALGTAIASIIVAIRTSDKIDRNTKITEDKAEAVAQKVADEAKQVAAKVVDAQAVVEQHSAVVEEKLHTIHVEINNRVTQLLEQLGIAKFSQGVLVGQQQERERPRDVPLAEEPHTGEAKP